MEQLAPASTGLVCVRDAEQFTALANRQPFLSLAEETLAVKDWRERRDREAGHLLIRPHLRLVVKIARRYQRQWPHTMDLIQEGNVGLMQALYRFDPGHDVRFGTYAGFWVKAVILRFLLDNWSLVRVGSTRAGRTLFFQLERERSELASKGIEATPELLAERLDLRPQQVREALPRLDNPVLSLEAPCGEGQLQDILAAGHSSPEAEAARSELSRLAVGVMESFAETLGGRDRLIWELRLVAEEPLSLAELGDRFGLSKQRVGQIEARIKTDLRARLEKALGGDVHLD